MTNNMNSTLLRPVLGIVLAMDAMLLKMKQLMSFMAAIWSSMQLALLSLGAVIEPVRQLRNVYQTLSL